MDNNILITGITGFLGKSLLDNIIHKNNNVNLIVVGRGKEGRSLKERIIDNLKENHLDDKFVDTITAIEDDNLTVEELTEQLKDKKIKKIIHLAANISFRKRDSEIVLQDNLNLTKKYFLLSKKLESDFIFISTAFVHGNRSGDLKENELIMPKKFNNSYEYSKFLCEQYLHNEAKDFKNKIFILRPGILISENTIDNNFGFYVIMKALVKIKENLDLYLQNHKFLKFLLINKKNILRIPILFVYNSKNKMDFISAEWVSEVISKITFNQVDISENKIITYHLSKYKPFSMYDLLEQTFEVLKLKTICIPAHKLFMNIFLCSIYGLAYFIPILKSFSKKLKSYHYYITETYTHNTTEIQKIFPLETQNSIKENVFYTLTKKYLSDKLKNR